MILLNDNPAHGRPLHPDDRASLGSDAVPAVRRFLAYRKAEQPTPLATLRHLGAELGVADLFIKDESTRLGLGSFKALGGAFAVLNLVREQANSALNLPVSFADLDTVAVRAVAKRMTFGCATDGNHGRSVAAGANMVGAQAVIFVHQGVSEQRVAAIAKLGARIVRVAGNYDTSVAEAARACAESDWTLVSDTSWPGYDRIPSLVIQGYTVIVDEALAEIEQPPTHVFIQAGVGGLAAAAAGHLAATLGNRRPKFIVVEPERAACVLQSIEAGQPTKIKHGEPTVMAMLECYAPSHVAWRILLRCADAFMTIDEHDAIDAMRTLAHPKGSDRPIVAGESGGASLAGLMRVCRDASLRQMLALGPSSRVLLINTEGATDPDRYGALVGKTPSEVLAA